MWWCVAYAVLSLVILVIVLRKASTYHDETAFDKFLFVLGALFCALLWPLWAVAVLWLFIIAVVVRGLCRIRSWWKRW